VATEAVCVVSETVVETDQDATLEDVVVKDAEGMWLPREIISWTEGNDEETVTEACDFHWGLLAG
jgi:hypothetical protein